MVTIKIISNPYRRETLFQKFDSVSDSWTDIKVNNPNSKLLAEDIVKNFFPYKVKQIVEQLLFDYSAGEDTFKIIFEGTEDEYHELAEVCKSYNIVKIEKFRIIDDILDEDYSGVLKWLDAMAFAEIH